MQDGEPTTLAEREPDQPAALLGVRGCEIEAIRVQDRVFLGGAHPDPHYRARREGAFIVAVHCARATSTCFCPSMGTGPKARGGHNLGLTELPDGTFYAEAVSERGGEVLAALPVAVVTDDDASRAAQTVATTQSRPALRSARWIAVVSAGVR